MKFCYIPTKSRNKKKYKDWDLKKKLYSDFSSVCLKHWYVLYGVSFSKWWSSINLSNLIIVEQENVRIWKFECINNGVIYSKILFIYSI